MPRLADELIQVALQPEPLRLQQQVIEVFIGQVRWIEAADVSHWVFSF